MGTEDCPITEDGTAHCSDTVTVTPSGNGSNVWPNPLRLLNGNVFGMEAQYHDPTIGAAPTPWYQEGMESMRRKCCLRRVCEWSIRRDRRDPRGWRYRQTNWPSSRLHWNRSRPGWNTSRQGSRSSNGRPPRRARCARHVSRGMGFNRLCYWWVCSRLAADYGFRCDWCGLC